MNRFVWRSLALWGGTAVCVLALAGILGLRVLKGRTEWVVRGGAERSEAEDLFNEGASAASPARHVLLGDPEKVVVFDRKLVVETYVDLLHGRVGVVPNGQFNFQAGIWQEKTFALFTRLALMAMGGGVLAWAFHFLLPKR